MYNQILKENQELTKQIHSIQHSLKELPEGNFFSRKNGKYFKWYYNDGTGETILKKCNLSFAKKLALKKYLELTLEELLMKKKATDYYLKHYNCPAKSLDLLNNPAYQELLSPHFKTPSQKIEEWLAQPFSSNPFHPERLKHPTLSGKMVRSKSEVLIDQTLFLNKIPFRYECKLQLGSKIIYPDFTILHPRSSEIFYWEHFGQMDNPNYRQDAFNKLEMYTSNNIIPTINLITTYETKEHPLTIATVNNLLRQYFF